MDKLGTVNSDTTMVDIDGPVVKLDPEDAFIQCLQNVGNAALAFEISKQDLRRREIETNWDYPARLSASQAEIKAERIIWKIREDERDKLFGNKASEAIPGPETLDMGGQFLTNKERIKLSRVFHIAQRMPKGCHLHLHFNAELSPPILVEKARKIPNMFIRSTEPLIANGANSSGPDSFTTSELVFNVMSEDTPSVNIFSPDYKGEFRAPGATPWMRLRDFITEYELLHGDDTAEVFILSKMVLKEEEVYGNSQTTNG
jgi:adenosine deaminase CECR1